MTDYRGALAAYLGGREAQRGRAPVVPPRLRVRRRPVTAADDPMERLRQLAEAGPKAPPEDATGDDPRRKTTPQPMPTVRIEGKAPTPLEQIAARMTRKTPPKPSTLGTAADIFLGQTVSPFSNRTADEATEVSLERYAERGGDPGKHAGLFGVAAATGAVLGNALASRVVKPVAATGGLMSTVARNAGAGAAENVGTSLAGSALFGTERDGTRDPMAMLRQAATQGIIGAGFGALGGAAMAKRAGLPDDSPDISGARTTGEAVRGSRVFAQAPEGQQRAGVVAYHGSPHKFDQFDMSKVGTGEGAQAYGHGLYFAEEPKIAKTYQAKVSAMRGADKPTIDGRNINWDDPRETAAFELARHNGDREAAALFYEQMYRNSIVPSLLRDPTVNLPKAKIPGHLYRADIPDEAVAKMLDWDKPLSEQPDVLARLRADGIAVADDETKTGAQVYEYLTDIAGGEKDVVSDDLRRLGIPGIKYLDQGSRATGEGTRNYVVFDDKLPKILPDEAPQTRGRAGVIRVKGDPPPIRFHWESVPKRPWRIVREDGTIARLPEDRYGRGFDSPEQAEKWWARNWRKVQSSESPVATGTRGRAGVIRIGGGQPDPNAPATGPVSTVPAVRRGLLPTGQEPAGTPYKAPIDEGADPRLANIKKLNLSPEAEVKIREAYTRLDLDKRAVSWDETKAAADELGINPRSLLAKSGRMRGHELLAVRDVISQNAKRMVDLSQQKLAATTDEARHAIQDQINALSEETDGFLVRYSTERTRAGRDLNALKILARDSMDPATWLAQAQRVKGPLPLTAEEAAQVSKLALDSDRDGLIRAITAMYRSTPLEKALTVWKAGLLTGLRTHEVNMVSNAAMGVAETVKEIPATAIDAVISAVRGTERTKAISGRGLLTEQIKGLGAGAKAAMRVLRYGSEPEQLAKWDFRKVNFGDGPGGRILQAYTDGVFRALGAADQVFKGAAMGRAMEEYARLEAKRWVKQGLAATMDEALQQLRGNLPPELVVKAIADAEVATFQQPNIAATMITGARRAGRQSGKLGELVAGATETVIPFVRTPTNVANTLLQYTPAGLISALVKQIGDPSQKRLAEDLGRTVTGSGVVALGLMLWREGKATGSSPKSQAERAQWELEGKQPNSVRIGNQWVNVSRLAPVGALLSVGAQMASAWNKADTKSDALLNTAWTPIRVTMDQPMVTGLKTVADIASEDEPGKLGRFAARQTASVVPAIVGAVARGTDPKQRDPKGIAQTVASRVPGLSRTVPERLDPFGRPMPQRGGVAKEFFDVTNSKAVSTDPLVQELARVGVTVGYPDRERTVQGAKETRTPDEYRAYLKAVGPETRQRLATIVGSKAYRTWDDERRLEELEGAITRARSAMARRESAQRRAAAAAAARR